MAAEQSSASSQLTKTHDADSGQGVYGALYAKINLSPVAELNSIEAFQNEQALSEAPANARVTAAVSVSLDLLKQSPHKVECLDKTLLDEHIASLNEQISRSQYGARGDQSRQDISSQVSGPILEHLHHNFATAWPKETGEDLLVPSRSTQVAEQLTVGEGGLLIAQLLRMRTNAVEQGNGQAAVSLGVKPENKEEYQVSLEAFQMGVVAGDESADSFLGDAFRGLNPFSRLGYPGQQENLERAERHEKIWRILANYPYAAPKIPKTSDILPLPPAKPPAWDGKLQWLKASLANVPPPKPTQALINQLAKAMVLDPATGKPRPGSPTFIKASCPVSICSSGQVCVQTGSWQAVHSSRQPCSEQKDGDTSTVVDIVHLRSIVTQKAALTIAMEA